MVVRPINASEMVLVVTMATLSMRWVFNMSARIWIRWIAHCYCCHKFDHQLPWGQIQVTHAQKKSREETREQGTGDRIRRISFLWSPWKGSPIKSSTLEIDWLDSTDLSNFSHHQFAFKYWGSSLTGLCPSSPAGGPTGSLRDLTPTLSTEKIPHCSRSWFPVLPKWRGLPLVSFVTTAQKT